MLITKVLVTISILIALSSNTAFSQSISEKEKLLKLGAEVISGTVVDVGTYNFFIQNKAGKEINIHTDSKLTQFYPSNERLVVGDSINVVFFGGESASGAIDKRLAFFVEFNEMAPREFLGGATDCIHLMTTRGVRTCYLPEYDKTISVEGLNLNNPPSFGQRIKIRLTVTPARIGNGYVYIARSI